MIISLCHKTEKLKENSRDVSRFKKRMVSKYPHTTGQSSNYFIYTVFMYTKMQIQI